LPQNAITSTVGGDSQTANVRHTGIYEDSLNKKGIIL